jgi:hypothetical protein
MIAVILLIHIVKFLSQAYLLNIIRWIQTCQCKTGISDVIVFNGHLVSMFLPLLIRMRPELKVPSYVFNIMIVIMSTIYIRDLRKNQCFKTCKEINESTISAYYYFYIFNLVMLSGLGVYLLSSALKQPQTL